MVWAKDDAAFGILTSRAIDGLVQVEDAAVVHGDGVRDPVQGQVPRHGVRGLSEVHLPAATGRGGLLDDQVRVQLFRGIREREEGAGHVESCLLSVSGNAPAQPRASSSVEEV